MKVVHAFSAVITLLATLCEGCDCPNGALTLTQEYCQATFVALAKYENYDAATGAARFIIQQEVKGLPQDQNQITVQISTEGVGCTIGVESFVENSQYLLVGDLSEGQYVINTGCGYSARLWSDIPEPTQTEWIDYYRDGGNNADCTQDGGSDDPCEGGCEDGYICQIRDNIAVCVIEDACSVNPCGVGEECSLDDTYGFVCTCADGYDGPTCQNAPAPSACPQGCETYFDGCNTCGCVSSQLTFCTRKYCPPQARGIPRCLVNTTPSAP